MNALWFIITKRIIYSYHTNFNPTSRDQYKPLELSVEPSPHLKKPQLTII